MTSFAINFYISDVIRGVFLLHREASSEICGTKAGQMEEAACFAPFLGGVNKSCVRF